MNHNLPPEQERERLHQLPKEELVEIIIRQAKVIEQLQQAIAELKLEIEKLRVSRDIDSKTSSKPPSTDLLKKPETQKQEKPGVEEKPKRRPGGQPGHTGKTRTGSSLLRYILDTHPDIASPGELKTGKLCKNLYDFVASTVGAASTITDPAEKNRMVLAEVRQIVSGLLDVETSSSGEAN